jgi:Ca2+-transporting ATPase
MTSIDKGLSPAGNTQRSDKAVGLSTAQASQTLQDEGPNELPDGQKRGLLVIARDTLSDPMFTLLLAAGVLYLVLGDLQEGLVLFGLVLVVLALTLYQEG